MRALSGVFSGKPPISSSSFARMYACRSFTAAGVWMRGDAFGTRRPALFCDPGEIAVHHALEAARNVERLGQQEND